MEQEQLKGGIIHELKIWKEYFDDVDDDKKNFEVRKLDRLFAIGDILWLREWGYVSGYTGRETKKTITYLMIGGQWGLAEGNCILGLANDKLIQENTDFKREVVACNNTITGQAKEIYELIQQNQQLQKRNEELLADNNLYGGIAKGMMDMSDEQNYLRKKVIELQAEKEKLMIDYMSIQTELNGIK